MPWKDNLKEFIDWVRRVHFVFFVAIPLLTGGVSTGTWAAASKLPFMWRISVCLFATGSAVLLLSGAAAWYVNKWGNRYIRLTDAQAEWLLADVKKVAFHATLLDHMASRARMLEAELEALWHRWDNVGEKLIHPLDAIDKLKGDDYSLNWVRRDFMVLYSDHINTVKSVLPEFTSNTITDGYPSKREYVDVLRDLAAHAEKLEIMAQETWNKF
jgi:hypothetical protein